jgi:hypothetical protein
MKHYFNFDSTLRGHSTGIQRNSKNVLLFNLKLCSYMCIKVRLCAFESRFHMHKFSENAQLCARIKPILLKFFFSIT